MEVEERLEEHHHYHCKLNPKGFERLKFENSQARREDRLQKQLKTMQSAEIEN